MIKYDIQLSIRAKKDYKEIVNYLKNTLLVPSVARNYANLINMQLKTLEYSPRRNETIQTENYSKSKYRKLIIKNYIAIYKVNEETKTVEIHRILYGASNWIKKL